MSDCARRRQGWSSIEGSVSARPRTVNDDVSWPAAAVSVAPIAKMSCLIWRLSRVVVPSWITSATNCASPAFSAGSTASPDCTVSTTDTFGTVDVADRHDAEPVGQRLLDARRRREGPLGADGGPRRRLCQRRRRQAEQERRGQWDGRPTTHHRRPPSLPEPSPSAGQVAFSAGGRLRDGPAVDRRLVRRHEPSSGRRLHVVDGDLVELGEDGVDRATGRRRRARRRPAGWRARNAASCPPSMSSRKLDLQRRLRLRELGLADALGPDFGEHAFDRLEHLIGGLVVQ